MEYYSSGNIVIRDVKITDAEIFTACEIEQGWLGATENKLKNRMKDVNDGKCVAIVADIGIMYD